MRDLEKDLKAVEDYFNNMSDEELKEFFDKNEKAYEKGWLPENQTSFYPCWYCGSPGHAVLCNDGVGRGFCPGCREKAEKEFLE